MAEKLTGFGATGNVYEELGVTTVINGQGTMTYLGGPLPRHEVGVVMALAAQCFIPIVDLEQAAGKRIVEPLKLPADYDALVTCGAAAGMQSGLAGILTDNNPKFTEQLPDRTGMKSEVFIQKSHRNGFDHQLRATGVKLMMTVPWTPVLADRFGWNTGFYIAAAFAVLRSIAGLLVNPGLAFAPLWSIR